MSASLETPRVYHVVRDPNARRRHWLLYRVLGSEHCRIGRFATRGEAVRTGALLAGWRGRVHLIDKPKNAKPRKETR